MLHDDDVRTVEAARRIADSLAGEPLLERILGLVATITRDDPRTPSAILLLLSVAAVLARRLPPSLRASICWKLNEIAEELEAKWH